MIQPQNLHITLSQRLDDYTDHADSMHPARLGVGLFTVTLAFFGVLTVRYTQRALRQAWTLTKTLAVLVFVYAVYQGMTTLVSVTISRTIESAVGKLVRRGTISERVGNVLTIALFIAALVAVMALVKWAVRPVTDSLPDPSQTSFTEFVDQQQQEDSLDLKPGTMAYEIKHGDRNE